MFRLHPSAAVFLCGLVAFASAAGAQTVDEIVAKNLLAKGGVDLLKSTTSVKMTGKMKLPQGEASMVVWAKRPNFKRNEMELGGQKMVQAFDGSNAWVQIGTMPPQMMPQGPQLEGIRDQAEFDTLFLNYKEAGHTIDLVGKAKMDGGEVYQLRVTSKQGPPKTYYLDAETGLERRIVSSVSGPDGSPAQLEMRFSDYRSVDGRMVPFVTEQVVNGKPLASTRIESIEFNTAADDKLFQMPPRQPIK